MRLFAVLAAGLAGALCAPGQAPLPEDPEALVRKGDRLVGGAREETAEGLDLWARAALRNHPGALVRLARALEEGALLPADVPRAMVLWQRAARAGSAEADLRLFEARRAGRGLPRNEAEAFHHLERAARRGHPEAQRRLASCLEHGRFVGPDPRRAQELYRQAARSGLAAAQNDLGVFLATRGGSPARPEAWAWFRLAAERGDPHAVGNRAELERRMGFGERRAARRAYRRLAPAVPWEPGPSP